MPDQIVTASKEENLTITFFDFPAEIRNKIYFFAAVCRYPIFLLGNNHVHHAQYFDRPKLNVNLLRASNKTNAEASYMLWTMKKFTFTISWVGDTSYFQRVPAMRSHGGHIDAYNPSEPGRQSNLLTLKRHFKITKTTRRKWTVCSSSSSLPAHEILEYPFLDCIQHLVIALHCPRANENN